VDSTTTVGLFVTCLVDLYRPNIGFASIKLLEQCGCEVVVPETQTCCGQPAYNSGDKFSAIDIAKKTIAEFESFEYVVAPSGSCAGMLKHHYPELLSAEPEWVGRAQDMARRVHELTSFLVDVMKAEVSGESFNATVTYHDSCAGLREMNIKDQPRVLLSRIADLNLNEMQETEVCCGFGGTFCVKYPDISERMVSDKVSLVEQSGADVLLGGDLGCLLNLSGRMERLGSPTRVYHVAEVAAGMADIPALGKADSSENKS